MPTHPAFPVAPDYQGSPNCPFCGAATDDQEPPCLPEWALTVIGLSIAALTIPVLVVAFAVVLPALLTQQ